MKNAGVEKAPLPRLPRLSAHSPSTASARWQAIVNRDSTVHTFVYGVRTTRIYCRPSCPARLARRANVEFYDSPIQAEAAGYRPCKRCCPQLHVRVDPHIMSVQKACETISSTCDSGEKLTLCKLAAEAKLSPSHFHRVFKKYVGVTPGQYAMNIHKRYTRVEKEPSGTEMMNNDHGRVRPLENGEGIDLVQHRVPDNVGHGTDVTLDNDIDWNMFDFDPIMSAEDSRLGWDFLNGLWPPVIDIPETTQKIVGTGSNCPAAESVSHSGDAVSAVGSRQELDIFEFLEDSMYQT